MAITEAPDATPTEGKGIVRVIDACVLEPIQGADACGAEDVRNLKLWVDLRAARPKADSGLTSHDLQRADTVDTDWQSYRDKVQDALCQVAKDLELGLFLTDASTRVFGFQGVRDGLWMLGGLISGFFSKGLYPKAAADDLEVQYGKLSWLNDKFPDVIRELPLTQSPDLEVNYSLNYRAESRRQGGMITAAQYDAAASAGTVEAYNDLLSVLQEARAELDLLQKITEEHYGEGAIGLGVLRDTIDECITAVRSILHKRQEPGGAGVGGDGPGQDVSLRTPGVGLRFATGSCEGATPTNEAWSACERLAQSGSIDAALSTMTTLAAAEPNGRIRFHRKLLLADLCLQTSRKQLGLSILEELNEIIDQHKLELWETSEIVGGVWARLVHCYRDKAAGTANQSLEENFYKKLSRLNPWQALNCGEMRKRD